MNVHYMAYSKSELFTSGEQQTAVIAKALAHPARIAILKVLAKYDACLCGEIVAELPLSQSTSKSRPPPRSPSGS